MQMTIFQKNLLQGLAKFFKETPNETTGDAQIAKALGISIHEARSGIQELSNQGYIKSVKANSLTKGEEERLVIIGLTSKGWTVIR